MCQPQTSCGYESGQWQRETLSLSGDSLRAAVNLGILGVVVEASIKVEALTKVKATIHSGKIMILPKN